MCLAQVSIAPLVYESQEVVEPPHYYVEALHYHLDIPPRQPSGWTEFDNAGKGADNCPLLVWRLLPYLYYPPRTVDSVRFSNSCRRGEVGLVHLLH